MATKFLDYTGLSYLWSKLKEWCNSIFVTKATDENITGTKTFVGSKKIAFKQSGANDKLGFTLFNNSGNEQGYLEYNPTNKIAGVPLMTLGNYATATNELTYVGFRRYSNISGASGAYNLLTPLISDAKIPFNLTTTYTNFYLPLGISDGTNIVTASNSGIFNISSLLSSISTIEWSNVITKPTTISGYGITDAKIDNGTITLGSNTITPLTSHQTLPTLSLTTSGSGNAITALSVSDHVITATKKSTFLTSHQDISGKVNKSGDIMTGNLTVPTVIVSGSFVKQHPSITKGTNPSATQYWTLTFGDKNGSNYSNNCLGMLETSITSAGVVSTYIRAMKNTAANSSNCQISCIYDTANNTAYTAAPTPATADNSTKIATTAYVKAQGYITSSGSITGSSGSCTGNAATATKLGTSTVGSSSVPIYLNDGTATACSYSFTGNHSNLTKGTNPSSTVWTHSWVRFDKSGTDTKNRLTEQRSFVNASGVTGFEIGAYDYRANQTGSGWLGVYNNNGTVYTAAPTPAAADNSTKIATTAFVKAQNYITSSSNITGTSANVTGTVAIANGGTGATTRLNAVKALTNENVGTGATYFLTITNSWGKAGYTSTADARTVLAMKGATSSANGTAGVVPAPPTSGYNTKYLRADGTWQVPPNTVYTHPTTSGNKHIPSGGSSGQILRWSADGTAAWGADNNTTYSAATQSAAGLMSAADKKKLDGIEAGADNIPVGAIIYYAKSTVPTNFLICNGGAVSRTTYATLFGVIGTTFGTGNGSSTFNVPNLIGRFPEGNATPGTVHNAGLPNITGSFTIIGAGGNPICYLFTENHTGAFSCTIASGADGYTSNHNNNGKCTTSFSAKSSNSIYGNSSTVQPPALTLVPCIRYA